MSKLLHHNKGKLFTIAAPSGTGKTSLVKALVDSVDNVFVSVSHTTRQKREREEHGVNYFFTLPETFKSMIDRGDFLEHAQVFNHYYGTTKAQVEKELAEGKNVILEIDWQGVNQIYEQFPSCQRIFILPPSIDILEKRLRQRGQDSDAIILHRLQKAREEISHAHESDHLILNDHFDMALEKLQSIVMGKPLLQEDHTPLVKKLLD